MHHPRPRDRQRTDAASRWPLLAVLAVAQLMVILDISAVNVALPDMASDLGIARADVGWTITSYSLIFGSLLLLGGRAADLLGRRRVFLTGLAVFTRRVAGRRRSRAAPPTLFAARAGQGLGAAMLSPAALSIIMTTFSEGRERARALGVWGAVGGAGAAIGVLLGGDTDRARRLAGDLLHQPARRPRARRRRAARSCRPTPAAPRWRGLDLRGAALATASFGALVYALSQASDAGWTSTQTLGIGGAGARRARRLRRARAADATARCCASSGWATAPSAAASLMMLAASAVLFGSFLLTSLYLQNVLGTGPMETGLAFLPLAVATGVGAHLGSQLVRRAGVRVPLAGALRRRGRRPAAARGRRCRRQLRRRRPARHADHRPRARRGARLASPSPCSPARATTRPGCCRASTPPATRSAARSASPCWSPSPPARSAAPAPSRRTAVAAASATRTWSRRHRRRRRACSRWSVLPSARSFLPKLRLAPSMPIH